RPRGEDPLDRVGAEAAAKADGENRRQLVRAEGGVLALQRQEGVADAFWYALRGGLQTKQAGKPAGLEEVRLPCDRAGGSPGLGRALGWRQPEHDDGTDELIHPLLRPQQMELERIPRIGYGSPNAFGCRHDRPRWWWLRA